MTRKQLDEYKRKRNFRKTAEPRARIKTSKDPVFVVQEHHASILHYDFRLEMNGVLKSWSVPKGPSMDPGTRRLAVEVEDHPVDYAEFEGKIPKGEYGGGEVFLWDKGTWRPEGDPEEALAKGKLEFELKGEKLSGRWLLIRTKEGKKPGWLLIRRRDDFALTEERPGFQPLQMAKLVDSPPAGENWLHEMKFDGYRTEAVLQNGQVTLYTRSGQNWTHRYPPILKALRNIKARDAVLDGEIVWLGEEGANDFQRLQNALGAKDLSALCYYVFDILFLDGKDLRTSPLIERKAMLEKILPADESAIKFSPHFSSQGDDFFQAACRMKMEGMISKRADSPYVDGRPGHWVKIKCKERQEFVIAGYTKGKGNRSGQIGALLLAVNEGGSLRYVGKVGTGFSSASLADLQARLKPLEQDESPFSDFSSRSKGIQWVRPELVAEIAFAAWTDDGMLRVPVFHGLREDKPAGQIIQELPEKAGDFRLTSPGRIFYKKEKISKQKVADYYRAAAPFLLPQIQGRPLSLLRCPKGVEAECFFQKHRSANFPGSVRPVEVKEKKGKRQHMAVDSLGGVLALVQRSALEFHTWNSKAEEIHSPDQIVMDFDPGPGVEWRDLVRAAFELRDMLEQLHLESFVKVTGGKGIHVHIPFEPVYTWAQVKAFAHSLALEMVSQDPDLYTAELAKKARRGKIFIDYLRNGEAATAIAPYSLRAKKTSSVAMPISWDELKKVKSASQFTLAKALEHIEKRKEDPWQSYFSLKQRIGILDVDNAA